MKPHLVAYLIVACSASLHAGSPEGKTQQLTSTEKVPEGLAKSDWSSIRGAYEAGRHAFQPVPEKDGVWQARNPGQQWLTTFDQRGFEAKPAGGDWSWGLELKSYGFGEKQTLIGGTSVDSVTADKSTSIEATSQAQAPKKIVARHT
jgi:hypothetical protein